MESESVFGVEPEQLSELLSVGEDDLNDSAAQNEPSPSDRSSEEKPESASGMDAFIEQPGSWVGPYKLLKVLGEGGMGIAYLAEQKRPMRRQVAIKVIKPGMDSRRVVSRFEAERQALALLDHPNIAHVHDAGTTELGRPYFVMEYVKGLSITDYCDHHRLTIKDRLVLFQQICHAVHHAHQKGIIHRDIKPSNILVSVENDRPTPKIIDFGVAKAIGRPLTDRTMFTEDSHLLGTPEYMSPEQADMATEDIDTRSDVYSLGVLLYVLLTGVLPFDVQALRDSGIEKIRKTIRETDPKTPSTRLTSLGEEAVKVAEMRSTEISTLRKHLKNELEWIPLKAMRKERSERYRSASELADDVENYLNGAPLIAGPPTILYRLKKFVRRNAVLSTAVLAVAMTFVLGLVGTTAMYLRAEKALAKEARARTDAQATADFLTDHVLGSVTQIKGRKPSVIDILNLASAKLEEGMFENQAAIEVSVRWKLAEVYWNLGYVKKVIPHREWLYRELLSQKDTAQHPIVPPLLWSAGMLAGAYQRAGEYQKAESLFNELIEDSESTKDASVYSRKINLAGVYESQGRYGESQQLYMEMMQTPYWKERIANKEGAWPMSCLAEAYQGLGQYAEAEKMLQRAIDLELERNERPRLRISAKLPILYVAQGRYQEAEALFLEVIDLGERELPGKGHLTTLSAMNGLAVLRTKLRQYHEAERFFQEVWEAREEKLGGDHPETLETINDFGVLRREQKSYAEAEKLLSQALDGRKLKLGLDHPACFESMHELAVLYKVQGLYDKAEELLLEAVKGRRLKLGDQHPHTQESVKTLIELYGAWDKPEKVKEWRAKLPQTEVVEP
ncbi:MAG: serine/threonine protein kinase [Phycisphaerae bacterium]|nr:serine/threonine protein kinase [Phycisphaerae bacterium]